MLYAWLVEENRTRTNINPYGTKATVAVHDSYGTVRVEAGAHAVRKRPERGGVGWEDAGAACRVVLVCVVFEAPWLLGCGLSVSGENTPRASQGAR